MAFFGFYGKAFAVLVWSPSSNDNPFTPGERHSTPFLSELFRVHFDRLSERVFGGCVVYRVIVIQIGNAL